MIKVTLIGTGNVSHHLSKAFTQAEDIDMIQVLNSRGSALSKSLSATLQQRSDHSRKAQKNIYIIAVSDDAINIVSQCFKETDCLVVHTSGSVSLQTLPTGINRGVFYPLQTFSKDKEIDLKTVPICIEAERDEDLELLQKLGESISNTVYKIDSEQRKGLHLAAVFTNNFANHLYQIASEICDDNNVPFVLLEPLIKETAGKISQLSPFEAQTGPAKRNDHTTISSHLEQLKSTQHKEIYNILTESIKATHGKKL